MPTLGSPSRRSSRKGPILIGMMVLGGAAGGALYWKKREFRRELLAAQPAPASVASAAPLAPQPLSAPQTLSPLAAAGLSRAVISVDGPLESAVIAEAGPDVGPALAQVITRTLVWWIQMPSDLRRGDKIEVLYQPRAGEEPLVQAVRFKSGKLERTFEAYRHQSKGDVYPRYYQPDGEELEQRLGRSPLDDYEQITSLIRDGRRHKGVDFRTPVGTPVKAAFSGVITRKNWNFRSNGNCLEVTDSQTGRKALYLHLDRISSQVRVGERVARGEVLANSGNSGHSFAPHLHFQLMTANDQVLDPFDLFEPYRRKLASTELPALSDEIQRYTTLLQAPLASR